MKQGKDRGVVIWDRSKYLEKCLSILSTSQFAEIDHNPTAYIEGNVQRTLRKVKNKLSLFVYSKIYSTGPSSRKFYWTAKLNKVPNNGAVEHLPLRPIISNIGTATYDLTKYLA